MVKSREKCCLLGVLILMMVVVKGEEIAAEVEEPKDEASREDKVMKLPPRPQGSLAVPPARVGQGQSPGGSSKDRGEVSETDLYLLSAIEKLAYRLDLMEKRLRRTEDLLFHVMEGQHNNKQPGEKADPCPGNFTRVAGGCYHFSSDPVVPPRRGSNGALDWQKASATCKALGSGAVLAELETVEETQDLVSHIKLNHKLKDKSYWTGGLNPGLLWIWADSGRPVSPTGNNRKPSAKPQEIRGSGRCLLLAYDAGLRGYGLAGADCAKPQHFVCEAQDNAASRALERIQRNLRLQGVPEPA